MKYSTSIFQVIDVVNPWIARITFCTKKSKEIPEKLGTLILVHIKSLQFTTVECTTLSTTYYRRLFVLLFIVFDTTHKQVVLG